MHENELFGNLCLSEIKKKHSQQESISLTSAYSNIVYYVDYYLILIIRMTLIVSCARAIDLFQENGCYKDVLIVG